MAMKKAKKKRKRKSRKGSGKAKGSGFEREISKRLSLWWTNGASSQVFWRNSGFLSRAGDRKEHQYGDVHAIDERGKWFVEHVNIELKFYRDLRILDIVDKPGKAHVTLLTHWAQCRRDAEASEREPVLIAKRNFAEPFVVCYSDLARYLIDVVDRVEFYDGENLICAFALSKLESKNSSDVKVAFGRLRAERGEENKEAAVPA